MNQVLKSVLASALLLASFSASAEVVVVVSAKSAATPMSKEQVSQFFLGKSASMTPIDMPEGSPARADFYKKVTEKDAAQVKALWSKLVFTGKAVLPHEAASGADVKKALNADPKAIGYIDKADVDSTVKVVLSAQ